MKRHQSKCWNDVLRAFPLSFYIPFFLVIGLDLVTKWLAATKLSSKYYDTFLGIKVISAYHAYSSRFTASTFFIIIAICAFFLLLFWIYGLAHTKTRIKISTGILVGGGVTNIGSVLLKGGTVDFIMLPGRITNIADIAIALGAILFVVFFTFYDDRHVIKIRDIFPYSWIKKIDKW